ncbi:MAG: tetratricopeptide repeat protein [Pyrinomonadaceae bacterium]
MKKDNIFSALLGVVAGLVVGFVFANSLNRQAVEPQASAANAALQQPQQPSNPALPADHPPLGASTGAPSQGAIPQVTEAIEKAKSEPRNYEAQMTAADLYYQIGRFEEAAKIYEAAIVLKPGDTEPVIKAGNSHFDYDNYEKAEEFYLAALAKDPKNIIVRTDLGLTYFLRTPRDAARAITEYKASLGIDPKHEITLQNLALAYKERGDAENLKATIERLKQVNPANPAISKIESSQ